MTELVWHPLTQFAGNAGQTARCHLDSSRVQTEHIDDAEDNG